MIGSGRPPTSRTIERVELKNSLRGLYALLHCKAIASYGYLPNREIATGDDEALLGGPTPLFWFNNYRLPLAGRVVITGVDDKGDYRPTRTTVEQERAMVQFFPEEDTQAVFEQYYGVL